MPRPPKIYKTHPIRWAPCCKKWIVLVVTVDAKLVWIYLKSWDKAPIYTRKLHKKHLCRWYPDYRLNPNPRPPKDPDFVL